MESTNKNFSIMESSQEFHEHVELTIASKLKLQKIEPIYIEKDDDEYEEKLLQVTRVTKVVKGGKHTSFRVILIVGDCEYQVGIGIGHGEDVSKARRQAFENGLRGLISIPLTLKKSIPHAISFSYGAARIMLKPASEGAGIIAGGAVRSVLELSGLKNIIAKQRGSSSILNNVKATLFALNALNEKVSQGNAQNSYRSLFYKQVMSKSIKPILFI